MSSFVEVTKRPGTYVKMLGLIWVCIMMGLLPAIAPVHADSQTHAIRVTRSPGTPNFVASKPGPLPASPNYAYVQWQANDNYSVTSSVYGGGTQDCVDTGQTPCFSLQLTTSGTSANYQWVFFVDHGQGIIACVTGNTNCGTSNECSWGSTWPADNFAADQFMISFSSATSFSMGVYNTGLGYSWCSFGSGSLSGLVSWEVSTGIGYEAVSNANNYGTAAVWSKGGTNEVWSVSGYAPSGVTMNNMNTYPIGCYDSSGGYYDGGSVVWYGGSSYAYTTECGNLASISWTNNSAQNFQYTTNN
jgi:hypothetical protein